MLQEIFPHKYNNGDVVIVTEDFESDRMVLKGEMLEVLCCDRIGGEDVYGLRDANGDIVYSIDHFKRIGRLIDEQFVWCDDEMEAVNAVSETPEPEYDNVQYPKHYNQYPVEVFDIIKIATADFKGADAFCLGNAIKYTLRCPFKGKTKEDLQKAVWYIEHFQEDGDE